MEFNMDLTSGCNLLERSPDPGPAAVQVSKSFQNG